jgi:hypothetical protein
MDISKTLDDIAETYQQIRDALNAKLIVEGYNIAEEVYSPKVFGNRYIIWSNKKGFFRLVLDGKEDLFFLAMTDALNLTFETIWNEIIFVSYNPRINDSSYANAITNQIVNSID